jgi:hypothetical protein
MTTGKPSTPGAKNQPNPSQKPAGPKMSPTPGKPAQPMTKETPKPKK